MVGVPGDLPDWTNAILLQGVDPSGDPIAVLLDASGQLFAVLRGVDALGDPQSVRVDSDGQLYTVLQGASGNAVAVDADGFITAVLKGQVAGLLTTIAVDASGRIEAFILDNESQWGNVLRVGNSDLAARLGSVKAWDWRGQVVCLDDFARGLPGLGTALAGTGAAVEIDPTYFVSGGYSAKLTGGSDGTRSASVTGGIGPNPSDVCGLEIRFSVGQMPEFVRLNLHRETLAGQKIGSVRIDCVNWQLQYSPSPASWTNVAACRLIENASVFNSFKFVLDAGNSIYLRAMVNDTEYDLSSYACISGAGATAPQLAYHVFCYSNSGQNDVIYLDSFVLTVGEPANA